MSNRSDFTIDSSVLQEAIDALKNVPQKYEDAINEIKKVTEALLEKEKWKGKTRDEFKETYRVVEHYLDDDMQRAGDIGDILAGFLDIYETADVDTAISLVDKVGKVKDAHDKAVEAKKNGEK